ncbi:MAG: hypothetical protein L6V89_08565 [Oscillospiraceae bacterium]|nr:MAG: hypothetical protein L6V89_08565 [Oscillospiraceae bacterium]
MLNAASFASYCRSRGLKCVVRDDFDSRSGNIAMIFSDESGKLPDVRVSLDFCIPGAVGLICAGFAPYNGTPERKRCFGALTPQMRRDRLPISCLITGKLSFRGFTPFSLWTRRPLRS